MTIFNQRLIIFSLLLSATQALILLRGNFTQDISIPQYHNYSIDMTYCYFGESPTIYIHGEASSLLKLELWKTQSFSGDDKLKPSLSINTSTIGTFQAHVETFLLERLCNIDLNITIFDPNPQDFPNIVYTQNSEAPPDSIGALFPESILDLPSAKEFLQRVTHMDPRPIVFTEKLENGDVNLQGETLLYVDPNTFKNDSIFDPSPNVTIYAQLLESNTLALKVCSWEDKPLDCTSKALLDLDSKIISLRPVKNALVDSSGKLIGVESAVAFITEDEPDAVKIYNLDSSSTSPVVYPMNCKSLKSNELVLFGFLWCISDDSITAWSLVNDELVPYLTIDASALGISDFKPSMISSHPLHPFVVLIKTSNSIIQASTMYDSPSSVKVQSQIQIPDGENFTYVTASSQLIVFTSSKTVQQYNIDDITAPRLINECFNCHTLEDFESEELVQSSIVNYMFAVASSTEVSVYNTMMPGFMSTFSSIQTEDSHSRIVTMFPLGKIDLDQNLMMLIYSLQENKISFYRTYFEPILSN